MKYLEWLAKGKYQQDGEDRWSRITTAGGLLCKENGKLRITVIKTGNLFQMSVRAFSGVFWVDMAAYQLDEDCLIRRGNQIEMRLVDAWREFN